MKMSAKLVSSSTDTDISTLSTVLDSTELSGHLQRILPFYWGALRDIQIKMLRHHRGKRCTVEILLLTTTGWRHLIGKVYSKDRSDIYQTMEALKQAGFGPEAEFSIPQPLAYLPELRLLLCEKVQGLRADQVFLLGNEQERTQAAERCARWLTQFQAAAAWPRRTLTLTQHVMLLERWFCRLATGGEPLATRAKDLFERLVLAASAHDSTEMRPSHGDFGTRNIIFSENCMVVYDWDACKLANPCRDVASFIVDLSWLALRRLGSIRALDATAKAFQKTYIATGSREAAIYLPFYKAARCLEVVHIAFRKQHARWRENVEAMIDEGFFALEQIDDQVDEVSAAQMTRGQCAIRLSECSEK
jgi:aminoglycoside phosphotransferase (APT) family kinase protein